jgi:hypothetical protein
LLIAKGASGYQLACDPIDIRLIQDLLRYADQTLWHQRLRVNAQPRIAIAQPAVGLDGPIVPFPGRS